MAKNGKQFQVVARPLAMSATAQGTARYRTRFAGLPDAHFRSIGDLSVSSLGLGSYLGKPDDDTDTGYRDSARAAWRQGCNVIDTAINYRHQRSERALGSALREAIKDGEIGRDEILVATKGGYLPFDGDVPPDPAAYLRRTYLESGLCRTDELVAGCHCLAPAYLRDQLGRSLKNLGLESVDIYYLHNPEQQLDEVDRPVFLARMRRAFETLEEAVAAGRIGVYGTATWNGYRVGPSAQGHLSLAELVGLAREVGGERHRFRVVQLPFNLAMPEALVAPTQMLEGEAVSALDAATRLGISVMTSGSILQGRLARRLPESLRARLALGAQATDAQRALQLARSAPGVTVALCGMSRVEHVAENLALSQFPPLGVAEVRALLG